MTRIFLLREPQRNYLYSLAVMALVVLSPVGVRAQKATDGTTPTAMAPGAPAGSYALSGFENINAFNGNLSAHFPLLHVGGRGSAGYTMMLSIERHWQTGHTEFNDSQGNTYYNTYADPNWWGGVKPGYGPGVLQMRTIAADAMECPYGGWSPTSSLLRFTFTAPDGTEYELVDALTGGQAHNFGGCYATPFSRGNVFVSIDGSALTFISDQPVMELPGDVGPLTEFSNGVLLFRDGTRYRIDAGLVSSIRDRNGNTVSFSYGTDPANAITYNRVLNVTDSSDRQVSIAYANNSTVLYDQINFKGFGRADRTIRVWYANLGQVLRSDFSLANGKHLFPELAGDPNDPTLYNPSSLVSALELPDGRRFQFAYNPYAELARVLLPTGGAVEYDHTAGSGIVGCSGNLCEYGAQIYRRTIERRVYPNGSALEGKQTWTSDPYVLGQGTLGDVVTVDQRNSANQLLSRQKHYYFGSAIPPDGVFVYYSRWKDGKEYQTESIAADGATGLTRVTHAWQQRASANWAPPTCRNYSQYCTQDDARANDPRVVETITTLVDTNQVSKTTSINPQTGAVGFDQFNNPTDTWEYDYGSSAPGALLRHTHTDYLTVNPVNGINYTDRNSSTSPHVLSLPVTQSVFAANEVERARTKFEYDNYSTVDNYHAPIQTYPRSGISELPISGLDASFNSQTGNLARGNATALTRYLFNNNGDVTGSISSYTQYDVAGNPVKILDPRSTPTNIIATTFDFSDRYGAPDAEARANSGSAELNAANQSSYAIPTKVTNALGQTTYAQFDYYLGRAVDAEDVNGTLSSSYFNDALDRPTQFIRASNDNSNPSAKSQTTFVYDDAHRKIITTSDQNSFNDPNPLKSEVLYDGMGRTIESRQYETATNFIAVQTQYDALGQAFMTSNPFRPTQDPPEDPVWTISQFDALGRVISVETPDHAVVKTSYDGNRVLVADQNSTDQARRKRVSKMDALGRLTDVWEITAADSATEAVSFPNWTSVAAGYHTGYEYDTLNNLITVTQGNQTRSFVFDSLKRLTSATNPESGATGYQYDEDGNLTEKIDPRLLPNSQTHIITTFEYDALDRLKTRTYNDSTPGVTYSYDTVAQNGKGRLTSVSSSVSTYSYSGYDALGRPLGAAQTIGSQSYTMTYSYDLAGHVKTITYPSLHSVAYNYDDAGRLADQDAQHLAFTGNLGDGGASRNYSTGIIYSPLGGMAKEQLGTTTAIFNKRFYNMRGQLAEIRESTSYTGPTDTSWNRGAIINDYSDTCSGVCTGQNMTDNNGNLKKQQHWIPATDGSLSANFVQQYDYDSLNRLSRAADNLGTPTWRQEYHYDRYGNRTITVDTTGLTPHSYAVSDLTNKLYGPGETDQNHTLIDYDLAGNQKKDYYTDAGHHYDRTYDAENRMKTSTDGAVTSAYGYDGDGHRVKRLIGVTETWQVYGIDGELLAEYAAGADHASPQKEYGYRNGELLITIEAGTASAPAPSALGATPATGNITLNWTAAAGATNYRIERKGASESYASIGTSSSTTIVDSTAANGSAYLYRVCAANGGGACTSNYSNVVLGARFYFPSDSTLCAGSDNPPCSPLTAVKHEHINELRNAINAVRLLAGLPVAWSGLSVAAGDLIFKNDVQDMRDKLREALDTLGIQTSDYEDNTLYGTPNGTLIRAIHIRQLRQRATSGVGGAGNSGGSGFQIHWLATDQLGTPRMIFDQTGSLSNVSRHDYLPFGEELSAQGGRGPQFGYSADNVRQKFTQKERDNETGTDYFLARYYSSPQGRFTSTDHFDGNPAALYNHGTQSSALPYSLLENPQTLNSYSYVQNNPLSYVDSDGHKGGKYKPVPGSGGYTYRADVSNMNDSPNLHIYDRREREIGRVAIKGTPEEPTIEWEGKVPASVKENVESLIREQLEVGKWLPRPAPQTAGEATLGEELEGRGPEFEGGPGGSGASRAFTGLLFFQIILEAYIQYQESQRFGYYWNVMGEVVITNLDLARHTLPRGTYSVEGHHFLLTKNDEFVGIDDCKGCTVTQDKDGKLRVRSPVV